LFQFDFGGSEMLLKPQLPQSDVRRIQHPLVELNSSITMTAHPSSESVGNPTATVRKTGYGLAHAGRSWLGLIAAVCLWAGGSAVLAQTISDDFNDGNDSGLAAHGSDETAGGITG
jgi:hypothetical protein